MGAVTEPPRSQLQTHTVIDLVHRSHSGRERSGYKMNPPGIRDSGLGSSLQLRKFFHQPSGGGGGGPSFSGLSGGGGGGGGGTSLYGLYGEVPLDRVWSSSSLS